MKDSKFRRPVEYFVSLVLISMVLGIVSTFGSLVLYELNPVGYVNDLLTWPWFLRGVVTTSIGIFSIAAVGLGLSLVGMLLEQVREALFG